MTIAYKHTCDRCLMEETTGLIDLPPDWGVIGELELCPACLEDWGELMQKHELERLDFYQKGGG